MNYTSLFFDLDDTLYPSESGLWEAILYRMQLFMAEKVGLSWDVIPDLRRQYFQTYGTTLRGLQKHYKVNTDEYLAFVHDLPLENYLKPAPELHSLLMSLPQRRWIFTNADIDHATRVLRFLGLDDCFQGIIDIRATGFACKPERAAYQRALELAGEMDAHSCVMFDDSATNLMVAHQMGFTTVLVGHQKPNDSVIDYWVRDLLRLNESFPQLWDGEKPKNNRHDRRSLEPNTEVNDST